MATVWVFRMDEYDDQTVISVHATEAGALAAQVAFHEKITQTRIGVMVNGERLP